MILRPLHQYSLLLLFFTLSSSCLFAQIEAEGTGPSDGDGVESVNSNCAVEGTLIINEIGNYTDDKFKVYGEFIELVAVGENPELPIDVEGFIIDDNHSASSANGSTQGHIRLGDCFSEIMPGTIVLLYDNNRVLPGINTLKDGAPNTDGVYQIPFNHPCLTYVAACPHGQNTSFICPSGGYGGTSEDWQDYIDINDSIDVVQVRSDKFDLEHATMWWPNTGSNMLHFPDENSAKAVKVSEASVYNRSISFVDTDPYDSVN